MSFARLVAVVGVLVLVSGCKSVTEGARERFSKDHSCPLDRVEVRMREDLRPSDLETRPKPSPEIAADPGRLRVWQEEETKARELSDRGEKMVEVRGCAVQTLYACHRHNKDANYIMCGAKEYVPGVARW